MGHLTPYCPSECGGCAAAQQRSLQAVCRHQGSCKPYAGSRAPHLLGLSAHTTLQGTLDTLHLNRCTPFCCLQPFSDATCSCLQAPTPLWGWMPQGRPTTHWPRLSSGGCCLLANTPARWVHLLYEQGASAVGNKFVLQPGAQLLLQWLQAAGGHSVTHRGWPFFAVALSHLHMPPLLRAKLHTYNAPSLACPASTAQTDFSPTMVSSGLDFHHRHAGAPRHCWWRHADGRA